MIHFVLCLASAWSEGPTARILADSWVRPQVIGHRGAAAHAPENTLRGFRLAIASGAVATECDVHVDAEGNLAVIHD
ncbi:MAG: glycerophosphodiester phosphodiesterase, partial [Nitrospirae bacterium]|nr:glycerophosphodiester phosphodiesterase [Fimbriimonadaceae bacterium]